MATLREGNWQAHEGCDSWQVTRDGERAICRIHYVIFDLPTYEEIHNC